MKLAQNKTDSTENLAIAYGIVKLTKTAALSTHVKHSFHALFGAKFLLFS